MKKILALILALALALSLCAVSFADDPDEIPGTVTMPAAGLRFVPTELMRNAKGTIVTDGAIPVDSDIYMAYWVYFLVTEDEFAALTDYSTVPYASLFTLFSIGGGMDFDAFNEIYYGNTVDASNVRLIGQEGDVSFYIWLDPADEDYASTLADEYRDEYLALVNDTEATVAGVTCSAPDVPTLDGISFAFETKDLEGNPVSSADLFAQNEVTMVNIWATWCGPCIGELAELQKIHERLQEKGCGVIGILIDEDIDAAKELMAEYGVTYPVILTPADLSGMIEIAGYPTTFFVGRDGNGMGRQILGAQVDKYESKLEELLQSKAE